MMLNEYRVPDKEQRITMSMRFESEDLGSQTSSTDSAHKGIKPKSFNVSLVIPFADDKLLRELMAVAESVEDDGSLTMYDITDSLANAVGVRQVQFADNFTAREATSSKAWQVSFSLKEHQSTAEKIEQRQEASAPEEQAADGTAVATTEVEGEDGTQQLTGTEKFLAGIDKALS